MLYGGLLCIYNNFNYKIWMDMCCSEHLFTYEAQEMAYLCNAYRIR